LQLNSTQLSGHTTPGQHRRAPFIRSVNVALDIPARLWTIYTYSFRTRRYALFFRFLSSVFCFTLPYASLSLVYQHLATTLQRAHIGRRVYTLVFQQLSFIQHTYPSVTPKTVRYNLADSISDTSHVYKLLQRTREEQRSFAEYHPATLLSLSLRELSAFLFNRGLIPCRLAIQSILPCRCADLRSPASLDSSFLFRLVALAPFGLRILVSYASFATRLVSSPQVQLRPSFHPLLDCASAELTVDSNLRAYTPAMDSESRRFHLLFLVLSPVPFHLQVPIRASVMSLSTC